MLLSTRLTAELASEEVTGPSGSASTNAMQVRLASSTASTSRWVAERHPYPAANSWGLPTPAHVSSSESFNERDLPYGHS
jgi:hypothetical protein